MYLVCFLQLTVLYALLSSLYFTSVQGAPVFISAYNSIESQFKRQDSAITPKSIHIAVFVVIDLLVIASIFSAFYCVAKTRK
ncbi:hypothetical protein BX661DRAFT_177825 [Kickxella alabastrina]|uniref:uncharacterized protein n=1 Tax=Kickxella alabastrina TaxID=61397 RepID=UPI00221EA698|nr:uncharacterized protein BX661DRAFT_177825 [Kickxella alabastrina]KAI7833927.1 hypothetical protein BX661DRAFT_177825 [Kickxella alabastrina]